MKETKNYEREEYSGSTKIKFFNIFNIRALDIGNQDETRISKYNYIPWLW